MRQPVVSVIMPFLDPPGQFFSAAIDSVRAQTIADWELILVDDGSRRKALAVAREAASTDERIRLVKAPSPRPSGASAARNAGFEAARGDFIALLDADDVYEPSRLERHATFLRAHSSVAMVFGDTLFWKSWRGGRDFVQGAGVRPGRVDPPGLVTALVARRLGSPCTCACTIRRDIVTSVGGFKPEFRGMYGDQVFFVRIGGAHETFYLRETLDRYRLHAQSMTEGNTRGNEIEARRRFVDWVGNGGLKYVAKDARAEVTAAVEHAYWQLRHPRLATVERRFRKLLARVGIYAPGAWLS